VPVLVLVLVLVGVSWWSAVLAGPVGVA